MFPLDRENAQILRTKRWMYEALMELLNEMPFASITVGHICKRAAVSRTVFYNHYDNKEALLREIFQRIMTVYRIKVERALSLETSGHTRTIYRILCKELMRSRAFFRQLHRDGFDGFLVDFFAQSHGEFFQLVSHKKPPEAPEYIKYFVPYHANGLSVLLFQWLCDEDPISPEQMADIAIRLLRSVNVDFFLYAPAPAEKQSGV